MTWEGNLVKTYEVKIKIAHTSYFNNFNVKFHKNNHLGFFWGFFLGKPQPNLNWPFTIPLDCVFSQNIKT